MPILVILASLGTVVLAVVNPGIRNGGLISPTNYDLTTIFIVFGVLVSPKQHRWWLTGVAVTGLFFTGAETALFAVGVLLLVVVARKDWSRRLWLPVACLASLLVICTPFSITQKLWSPAYHKVAALVKVPFADNTVTNPMTYNNGVAIVVQNVTDRQELLDTATNLRWLHYWKLSPIKPLGYGYNINYFYMPGDAETGNMTAALEKAGVTGGIPHNVVLVIIEQLGVIALGAWLVIVYKGFRSGWTYAWIGYVVLGIWDHELWTVAAPLMFILAGTSSANPVKEDYIYR